MHEALYLYYPLYDTICMEIKEIVSNIIKFDKINKIKYICSFLDVLHLDYKVHTYRKKITNIEVIKKGDADCDDIIFLAHYDISQKTVEGANDNASSVAVLLKICTVLHTLSAKSTIRIVFNDNEELLGALNGYGYDREFISKIIANVGSYQYLKNYYDIKKIKHCIILELCGIGDSVFIAEKSGGAPTDELLNAKLHTIGNTTNINTFSIEIPSTDMVSVNFFNVSGSVIGAIPYYQAKNYKESHDKRNQPGVWSNIHSTRDNLFAINHRALDMCYRFVLKIINDS
ncbi:MAG: hypothetical protein A2015_01875 [Spirochaetes bacterium GWF1_31_7]|nr:MAG: hypothetical protein A2Y30_00825 [Spirochaetes bacterium GWE1_32_154]OHD45956.1 MAG: hypothetical protein A2Y29_16670 [Spirochaetes bacterium GWE2_31_10]OHD48121.1 MAG: hypothetical protein A2015_01875 [Spirochaetes bacterium GWF1_31_7]OHD80406.1 MAG: hypothetical protein A2355_13055 [Spirochaetes bacterium RIFOXYB1_FULL_32_8]HBD95823.1 hypothetical protein [Spirochaetia bacterium]